MKHSRSSGRLQSYMRYLDYLSNKNCIYYRNPGQKSYITLLNEQLTPEKSRAKSLIAKSQIIKGKILGLGKNNGKNVFVGDKIFNNFDKSFNNDEIISKDSIDKNRFKTFLSKSLKLYIIIIAMEEYNKWKKDMEAFQKKADLFDHAKEEITSNMKDLKTQNENFEKVIKEQNKKIENIELKLDSLSKAIKDYMNNYNNTTNKGN